jgi:hypothetical protein
MQFLFQDDLMTVRTLVDQNLSPCQYSNTFNTGELASGFYFYKLRAGAFVEQKRMILVK